MSMATALVPGKTYDAVVEMDDIAHAFLPGHRIAVSVSTTYWPIAWPSPELATLQVMTGESVLELPVRPPRKADATLRAFDPPERAPQTPHTYLDVEKPHQRRVTRDLLSGKMVVDFPRWTFRKEMPDIDTVSSSTALARYEITDGDPLSAVLITQYDVLIERKDASVFHRSEGKLSLHGHPFHCRHQRVGGETARRSSAAPGMRGLPVTWSSCRKRKHERWRRKRAAAVLKYAIKRISLAVIIIVVVMLAMYAMVVSRAG